MYWEINLAPKAQEDIARLSFELQRFVEEHLDKLAENPIGLGRKAVFPYLPKGLMYQFDHPEGEEQRGYFTILFHYGPGEKSLEVTAVGHVLLR